MRYLGVDPGLWGGVAALDDQGRVIEVAATPIVRGEKGRRAYDLDAIRALLWRLMAARPTAAFVTIEKLHAMPMTFRRRGDSALGQETQAGGVIANYNRGVSRGWEWMACALGVPRETRLLVRPQEWQRVQLAGAPGEDTKAQSIAQAKRLWPAVSLVRPRGRVESDGIADALHVAQFGRQVHQGGPLFAPLDSRRAPRERDIFRRA